MLESMTSHDVELDPKTNKVNVESIKPILWSEEAVAAYLAKRDKDKQQKVRVSNFFNTWPISFLTSSFLVIFPFVSLSLFTSHAIWSLHPSVDLTCQLMNNIATVRYGVQFTTGPSQEKPKGKISSL